MNFIEMIGFVISLLALFVLAAKKALDEKNRRDNPEEYEREEKDQAEKLKAFLKSIDMDMEESPAPKPIKERSPPKQIAKQHTSKYLPQSQQQAHRSYEKPAAIKSKIEERKIEVTLDKRIHKSASKDHYKIPFSSQNAISVEAHQQNEKDAYALKSENEIESNRAQRILTALKSKKDMIILNEIISPPKALRKQ